MDKSTLIQLGERLQTSSEKEKQTFLRQPEAEIKAETHDQAMERIRVLRKRVAELKEQLLAGKPTPVNGKRLRP